MGVGTKDADPPALGELPPFVVEVFARRHVLQEGPPLPGPEERRGKDDGVEGNVVLPDELKELDVIGISPPRFPVVPETRGNRNVADRCVEPDVEDLLLVLLEGNRNPPLQVPGDGAFLEPVADPRLGHLDGVLCPPLVGAGLFEPRLQLRGDCRQVDVEVAGLSHHGGRVVDDAPRIDQVRRIEEFPAVLTLIPPGVLVSAVWAGSPDVAVGEEHIGFLRVELFYRVLGDVAVLVELQKDVLGNLGMVMGRRPAELVEGDVEPAIDVVVDGKVAGAELGRGNSLFPGPGFGGGPVLVGATDVERLVTPLPAEAGKDIRGKNLHEVSQVRDVVYVR